MIRVARRVLLIGAVVWVLLAGAMYLFQRRLLYFPDPHDVPLPRGFEDVTLRTADDVELRGWYQAGTRRPVLVFFHGNGGNRGGRLDWIQRFHALGWGVFIFDYRGYGGSGGSPTEEGLARDADAAVAWLEARGKRELVYFGESLGCGVAVDLATRRAPRALVLQAGAASIADIGQKLYPWLPVRWVMKDRYDAAAKIGPLKCPLFSIHGARDRLVPVESGRELYDAATGARFREWWEVGNAGHNDLLRAAGRRYLERVHAFLERATSPS